MSDGMECRKAAEKALKLLLVQDRTRQDLSNRLMRAGYSVEAVQYALSYAESFGYVDDLRYARNYLFFHKGERSRKELEYKLKGRGITAEVLKEAFMDYEAEEEEKALQNCLRKRLRGKQVADLDYQEKQKTVAYLARKGFAPSAVRRILEDGSDG